MSLFILILKVFVECVPLSYNKFLKIMILHVQNVTRLLNWDSASKDALLQLIVQHWVTVRGFSFSAAYMEKYKQKHKKTVQKSKGIRKTLLGTKKSDVE